MTGTSPPRKRQSRPRTVRLTRRALHKAVWSKPLAFVAADLGISANGLAKICDRVLVPYPGRGHWSKVDASRPTGRPALPGAPHSVDDTVTISKVPAPSRRARTRLSRDVRVTQLIDTAGRIIAKEGLRAATLKRVARETGLSEAQVYNYFAHQKDMLVALARRELAAMNSMQRSEIERVRDPQTRMTISTIIYLRQVSARGTLIQTLLNDPDVRLALRDEHRARRATSVQALSDQLKRNYAMPSEFGYGLTAVLTAVCLRAGRLLASRKISLEMAERMSLSIVLRGNRDLVRASRRGTSE